MTPKKLIEALSKGADDAISILVIGAAAGMIIGSISFSGTALRLSGLVLEAAMGIALLALIYVAVLTLIMGMGVPTTAAYVMTAALAVPALSRLGVDTYVAHFFIFYYATISAITPPVALAAYAAASIAKDDPMKIGLQATKLGIAAILTPFILIFKPELLLIAVKPLSIMIMNVCTAFIAIYAIAAALEGYIKGPMNIVERALLFIGGITLFAPTTLELDLISLLMIALGMFIHYSRMRKSSNSQALKSRP